MTFTTHSPEETAEFARIFIDYLQPGHIITLSGDLGAGKTTFSQALLSHLGAEPPFPSPTFTIINQYDLQLDTLGVQKGIERIYHIDAYRSDGDGMEMLGWSDIVSDACGVALVEWPELMIRLLPDNVIRVAITALGEQERQFEIAGV